MFDGPDPSDGRGHWAGARAASRCRPGAGPDARDRLEPRRGRPDEVHHLSSAGPGEDRRHALRIVGRGQGANAAVSAADRRLRPGRGRRHRPSVQGRPEGEPPRRADARRRRHLSSRWHRLRRPLHLGARHRVPAKQPIDHLSRRSSDHEGRRGLSLRRFHRRHGARHGRPLPARRQLGLTPLLSLDPGRRREGHQRGRPAGTAAHAEHLALSRLSGLQVRRAPSHGVYRRHRDAPVAPPRRRSVSAASTSWISATAVRCTRSRSCSGPRGDWT